MKTINETFTEEDYKKLVKAKKKTGLKWHDFFMSLADERREDLIEDIKRCLTGDVPQTEELSGLMFKWQSEAIEEHERMKSYNE